MIKIETSNENEKGYQLEVHIEGEASKIVSQLVDILDHIYEHVPTLFELALLESQYTEDHT